MVENALAALGAEPLAESVDSQIYCAPECFAKAKLPSEHPFVAYRLTEMLDRQVGEDSWMSEWENCGRLLRRSVS
jgi:hypothetical protein